MNYFAPIEQQQRAEVVQPQPTPDAQKDLGIQINPTITLLITAAFVWVVYKLDELRALKKKQQNNP